MSGFLPNREKASWPLGEDLPALSRPTHVNKEMRQKENQPASWSWKSCIYLRELVLLPSLESENGKNSEKAKKCSKHTGVK
jgi:hypothetical protein